MTYSWKDKHDAVAAENERLRAALNRVLLDIDFLVEAGTLTDIRNDAIYSEAREVIHQQTRIAE